LGPRVAYWRPRQEEVAKVFHDKISLKVPSIINVWRWDSIANPAVSNRSKRTCENT
jgi:hypothetical protein